MRITYWLHAVERMYERGITTADVRVVLESGAVIEEYPEPSGWPGCLMLGVRDQGPVHVVVSAAAADHAVVITVYEPDTSEWESGFSRRRA